jgi:hypothetical protein
LRKSRRDSIPRRKSREFALQVLYQWEITKKDVTKILSEFQASLSESEERDEFLNRLILGVLEHCQEMIGSSAYSENWRLVRMDIIDHHPQNGVFNSFTARTFPQATMNEPSNWKTMVGPEVSSESDRIQNEIIP